jgi:hypothetical protein
LVGLPATITGRNRSGNRPNREAYLLDERRIDPKVQTHFVAEYDEHANGFFSAPE